MKHAALFNGIGGFQLAAEWMGWDNIMSCEIDEWCNKVTKYHFPNCIQHGDIKTTDFTIYRGGIDIITGGFPCQPYSAAGKRKGKEDERHLWPEMLRAIREIRPRWVVGENVRGLTNWNGGMVFDEVCADLEAEGYEVIPVILPAASVNAPHRRDRVWFIAYTNDTGRGTRLGKIQKEDGEISQRYNDAEFSNTGNWNAPNATGVRFCLNCSEKQLQSKASGARYGVGRKSERMRNKQFAVRAEFLRFTANTNSQRQKLETEERKLEGQRPDKYGAGNYWRDWPTQSPICRGDDGISGRLDGITFSKWRNNSIKGYGNAIVPQVAYQIFKAIEAWEKLKPTK